MSAETSTLYRSEKMANEKSNPSSQYSKMAMTAKNPPVPTRLQNLLAIGEKIVTNPKWQPQGDKTFCNFAVATAVQTLTNYNGFWGQDNQPLMANEIVNAMENNSDLWKKVTASDAWDAALQGLVAVAGIREVLHGHVALVAPGPRVWSTKWSAYYPQVFNVGKTINTNSPYTIGENFAFLDRPGHYVYVG